MSSLKQLSLLDALLTMCEYYQQLKQVNPSDQGLKDALDCILDCERKQMGLTHRV